MKLDTFRTLVEGRPVYESKMTKGGQYVLLTILIGGVAALVYYKFIRTPKFTYINKDVKNNRVQLKLDNKADLFYLNGNDSVNIKGVTIKSTLIKQSDSDLITGIKITETKDGQLIKEQTVMY